jgi:hypothetical protein
MSDKDVLMNALNSAHDFRLLKLDLQEDILITGLVQELENTIRCTQKKEIKRNRDRVCEIIAFIEKCANEMDLAEENSY